MTNKSFQFLFRAAAVVLIGAAAFFYYFDNTEGIFVAAVLGCVAFFLSLRYESKTRVEQANKDYLEQNSGEKLQAPDGYTGNDIERDGGAENSHIRDQSAGPQ